MTGVRNVLVPNWVAHQDSISSTQSRSTSPTGQRGLKKPMPHYVRVTREMRGDAVGRANSPTRVRSHQA